MISPQQVVMIVLGVVSCVGGYSMFRSGAPLWGFLLGGWLSFMILPIVTSPTVSNQTLYQVIAFIGGGLLGAVVAIPLYYLIVFFSGAALGALFGIMLGAVLEVGGLSSIHALTAFTNLVFPPTPQTSLQIVLMAIFGLIMGGAAIAFQKFMIIASSAFLGAAALISGLSGSMVLFNTTSTGRAAVMLIGWFIMAMVGMLIQFRMIDET